MGQMSGFDTLRSRVPWSDIWGSTDRCRGSLLYTNNGKQIEGISHWCILSRTLECSYVRSHRGYFNI